MDVLSTYLQYTKQTEPPTQYHRWAFITCIAAKLGRNIWIPFGHGEIYPNMYTMLIGAPGTRKSTSIKIARKLAEASGYEKFSFTKTTKEKFLLDFEEGFDGRSADGQMDMAALLDKPIDEGKCQNEVFICCDEFVDFIGQNNINFINLLTTMWDNLDKYQERLKNSKSVQIEKPTVNMLGGITPTSFATAMPPEVVGQGFMSRLLLIYGEPSKKRITWPPPPDPEIGDKLVDFFQSLDTLHGPCKISPEASKLIDRIYRSWDNLADVRLQYYGARRLTHLLKLCMICAVMHGTTTITEPVVVMANTLLTYTEQSMHLALGEFGESKNSKATQKIMEALQNASEPLTITDLWQSVSMDMNRYAELADLIRNLEIAKKVEILQIAGDVSRIRLLHRSTTKNMVGVDYETWIPEDERRLSDELELRDTGLNPDGNKSSEIL